MHTLCVRSVPFLSRTLRPAACGELSRRIDYCFPVCPTIQRVPYRVTNTDMHLPTVVVSYNPQGVTTTTTAVAATAAAGPVAGSGPPRSTASSSSSVRAPLGSGAHAVASAAAVGVSAFRCALCAMTFNDSLAHAAHVAGKRHRDAVARSHPLGAVTPSCTAPLSAEAITQDIRALIDRKRKTWAAAAQHGSLLPAGGVGSHRQPMSHSTYAMMMMPMAAATTKQQGEGADPGGLKPTPPHPLRVDEARFTTPMIDLSVAGYEARRASADPVVLAKR